jgi:DNA-binding MarR family transcriptional regulator
MVVQALSHINRDLLVPINCTSLRTRQFSRVVARFYDAHISKAGLKTSQFSLLTTVAKRGPIASGVLAERMGMSASTLTRNLKPLVASGWIEQLRCEDGRTRMIVATKSGLAKQAEAFAYWTTAQMQFNEAVGVDRVNRLQALMEECSANLLIPKSEK